MLSIIMIFVGAVMMNVGLRRIYQGQKLVIRKEILDRLDNNRTAKLHLLWKVLKQKELDEEERDEDFLEEAEYLADDLVYKENELYSRLLQTS